MRKILFRGWAIPTHGKKAKWVYGYYHKIKVVNTTNHYIKDIETGQDVIVAWETIGQYTGSSDKNGMKIFEGDIVREDVENKRTGYVAWIQQECGFVIVWEESYSRLGHRSRGGGYENDASLEIIGNIHDKRIIH